MQNRTIAELTLAEQASDEALYRLSQMRDSALEQFYRDMPKPKTIKTIGARRWDNPDPPYWHVASLIERFMSGDFMEPKNIVEINKLGTRHYMEELRANNSFFVCGFFIPESSRPDYENMMRNRRRLNLDEPYFEVALHSFLGYSLLSANGFFKKFACHSHSHSPGKLFVAGYSYGAYYSTKKKMLHIVGIDVKSGLVCTQDEIYPMIDFSSFSQKKPLTHYEVNERPVGDWI